MDSLSCDWRGDTDVAAPIDASEPAIGCVEADIPSREWFQEHPVSGFDAVYGTWIDHCICLRGTAQSKLLPMVLSIIDQRSARAGKGQGRSDYRANFELVVECVIANALRARCFRETGWVAYGRGHRGYWATPRWFNAESLSNCVDTLEVAGLLRTCKGNQGRASSCFRMTDDFEGMALSYAEEGGNLGCRVPNLESLIILRDDDDKKSPVRYTPTDETRLWSHTLDRYNRFLEQHDVQLVLSGEDKADYLQRAFENRRATDLQPKMVQPEFFRRSLVRIFNDGKWGHGGRFYRGWWQNAPSGLRRNITIDDQPTVELDYSGFLPRSIYHQNGLSYEGDPYEITEIGDYAEELGRPRNHFRKSVKKLLVALLNSDDPEGRAAMVQLEHSFLPRFSRLEVVQLLATKHPLLAGMFGTGEGKRNQRLDSDIAFKIMANLMDKGILVLPIHDSFVCKAEHEEELKFQMIDVYGSKLPNHKPVIKKV